MNRQTNSGVRGTSRTRWWMVLAGVALLPLAFEARAAQPLLADAVSLGQYDLLAVMSNSGGKVAWMYAGSPVKIVAGLSGVVKVASCGSSSNVGFALKEDGTLCTLTLSGSDLVAAPIAGIDNVVDIAVGPKKSPWVVVLKNDGTVWVGETTFVQVLNLTGAVAIGACTALGKDFAGIVYAVKSDGSLWACNRSDMSTGLYAARIEGIANATAVCGGYAHALALISDGTVMAFGGNNYGQLGNGEFQGERLEPPAAVDGLSGIIAVAAGDYHSFALNGEGRVFGWGANTNWEQLLISWEDPRVVGNKPFMGCVVSPVELPISDVVAIDGGRENSVALKSDHTVWVWGHGLNTGLHAAVQVTLAGDNAPPVVDSAPWADPATVTLPGPTTVRVVASDPDGDALTYAWSQVSGAGTASFATPAAADSGVTFSAAGSYVLRVTIGDGKGGSVSGDVTVTVQGGDGGGSGAGDLNGDKIVNIADLLLVIGNWGKSPSDAGYDARADADGNGLVNIQDVIIVAVNFGKTY